MNVITSSKRLIHKLRLFLLTFDMLTFFLLILLIINLQLSRKVKLFILHRLKKLTAYQNKRYNVNPKHHVFDYNMTYVLKYVYLINKLSLILSRFST